jgi:hypothetical protein
MRSSASLRFALVALLVVATTGTLTAQALTAPPGGGNQRAVVTQYMGMVSVTIDYNAPDTAETMPWRAGSNQATKITFSHDVQVEGTAVPAGTYALFMAPGEEEWTVILNKNSDAWGSFFYDPDLDVAQVKVKPQKTEFFREWLTYEFENRQLDMAQAVMHWEYMRVPFNISVPNIAELYHQTMSMELTGAVGFNFQNWMQAANWAAGQEAYHEDAVAWADAAIAANTSFQTLSAKAGVLNQIGRGEEAMEALDVAMNHPTATAVGIHMLARGLQAQGQMDNAILIFRKNYEMNAGEWPVDFGMARVYSQEGNFEKALEHAKIAKDRAPAGPQMQNLEAQIARLEKGENINP